jgi:hypothetical protein
MLARNDRLMPFLQLAEDHPTYNPLTATSHLEQHKVSMINEDQSLYRARRVCKSVTGAAKRSLISASFLERKEALPHGQLMIFCCRRAR